MLVNFQHYVTEHLNKTTVRIKSEPAVCRSGGHSFHRYIVQSKVQDGVHHARHRKDGAGTNGKKQGIRGVTEFFAGFLLDRRQPFLHLLFQPVRKTIPDFIVLTAYFRRDGHAWRHRQTDAGHLRQTGSLAAEQ